MSAESPFFSVELVGPDGAVRLDLSDAVERFTYVDRENKADKLTLSINNFDLRHFDDPVWKKGSLLDVAWGYPGRSAPTRRCVITKVTGGRTLSVEALGEEILMTTIRKTRTFERMTRSEVVSQIARENGFFQLHIQPTDVRYDSIIQSRRTDAEMLRRLANREGYQWYVDWDGFHWHERQVGQRPVRVFWWEGSRGSSIGDVLDFNIENDITARPGRVRLRGRNPETGETFEAEASNSTDTGRDHLAPILEVVDRESGSGEIQSLSSAPDVPVDALDTQVASIEGLTPELKADITALIRDGSTSPEERLSQDETKPTSAPNIEAARREARARFRNTQQAAVKMNLDLIGSPRLLAKVVVECRGFGRRLSVRYYVKEVTHTLDVSSGYVSKAKLISDGHGGHSTETSMARGLTSSGTGIQARGRANIEEMNRFLGTAEMERFLGTSEMERSLGPSELEPVTAVDEETGEEVTSWGDTGGRENANRSLGSGVAGNRVGG